MLRPVSITVVVVLRDTSAQAIALEQLLPVGVIQQPKLRLANVNTDTNPANVLLVETEDLGYTNDPLNSGTNSVTRLQTSLAPGTVLWHTFGVPFLESPIQQQRLVAQATRVPQVYHTLTLANPSLLTPVPSVAVRVSIYGLYDEIVRPSQVNPTSVF
jgi:hypothetical protein